MSLKEIIHYTITLVRATAEVSNKSYLHPSMQQPDQRQRPTPQQQPEQGVSNVTA